jgi:hypothetical protein
MSDKDTRNAVDDVSTETTDEEAGKEGHDAEARRNHGEGFDSDDLAKKGKESKENPPNAE